MYRLLLRYGFLILLVPFVFLDAVCPAAVIAGTWEIGVIDNVGDAGQYCELQIDSLGFLHAVYLRADLGELMVASGENTLWQVPERVDTSGAVGGHCAIAVTATGERRLFYYRDDTGSLYHAGPERIGEWSIGPVTSSVDNIGSYLSSYRIESGEVSVSCRNATAEALVLVTRDNLGVWSAPVTVDPGPDRGQYSDHMHHAGSGYVFSEYNAGEGALIYADTVMQPTEWFFGQVTSYPDDIGACLSCS